MNIIEHRPETEPLYANASQREITQLYRQNGRENKKKNPDLSNLQTEDE